MTTNSIFVGTVDQYEDYKKTEEGKKNESLVGKESNKIAFDNMDPISDEDLKILKTTRNRHDALDVYMQADDSFYDETYNEDDSAYHPLLKEAKKIKRMYKSIEKYLDAMYVRDLYLEYIVQKYGGPELFEFNNDAGLVSDWIPPMPVLSQSITNQLVPGMTLQDLLDAANEVEQEVIDEFISKLPDKNPDDIEIEVGVETNPFVLSAYNRFYTEELKIAKVLGNPGISGVNSNNLNELDKLFSSWYNPASKEVQDADAVVPFSNTPENIKKKYYSTPGYTIPSNIRLGDNTEEEENLNEIIIDPVTDKSMSRGEYHQRRFIRLAKEYGFNEVRLMRLLGVGSNYERQAIVRKNKNKRKNKKIANDIASTIMGISDDPFDIEDMRRSMYE